MVELKSMRKNRLQVPWSQIGTLLHDRAHHKPNRIAESELIFHLFRLVFTRMSRDPFVRTDATDDVEQE
jgi:hypothetical protein